MLRYTCNNSRLKEPHVIAGWAEWAEELAEVKFWQYSHCLCSDVRQIKESRGDVV